MANVTGSGSCPVAISATKIFGYARITSLIVKNNFVNRIIIITKDIAPSCMQLNRNDTQYRYYCVLYAGIGERGGNA
jgi:hypothetical protein